jgi:hypothetical protein
MNKAHVDQIVEAVLYEGYMLYPYRPSVKNHERWTFGGLFPRAFSETQGTSDAWAMQIECLLRGTERTKLGIDVRFLHLIERIEQRLDEGWSENAQRQGPNWSDTSAFSDTVSSPRTWQEAEERTLPIHELPLSSLVAGTQRREFEFPPRRQSETTTQPGGVTTFVQRWQMGLQVIVEVSAQNVAGGLFKIRVRIENHTPLERDGCVGRGRAQMFSLASTHCILVADKGEFVSLVDPSEDCREDARSCENLGAWPVLVGDPAQRDTVLASPIILYDYPQIAPESPGNLFDSTEIDEILTLRILALTDEEKQAAAATDERTRILLERTETLARDQLTRLHGTIRGLQPMSEANFHDG